MSPVPSNNAGLLRDGQLDKSLKTVSRSDAIDYSGDDGSNSSSSSSSARGFPATSSTGNGTTMFGDHESHPEFSTTADSNDDEMQAVRNVARKDTFQVRLWRLVTTAALLATGVTVTWATYHFLDQQQTDTFETAFEQFARTVGDAAVDQQLNLRHAYIGLANHVSNYVVSTNASWPDVTIPFFRTTAETVLEYSGTEIVTLLHMVKNETYDAWVEHSIKDHGAVVMNANLEENGNLDDFTPANFHPYVAKVDRSAGGFVPDYPGRERKYVLWEYAPAPFDFSFLNWNVMSAEYLGTPLVGRSLVELRTETLFHFAGTFNSFAFKKEEHEAMHARLPGSKVSHPHTFAYHPVHEVASDPDSEIVGILIGVTAWDTALNQLLPNNVQGITAVISNTCNQTFTYEIHGEYAYFQGYVDTHDTKYDKYEKVRLLTTSDHPDFAKTPGHCIYTMHIYPSRQFEEAYDTFLPEIFAIVIFCAFVAVIAIFFVYDMFVNHRNEKLIENAARSNVIVSTLFPSAIRDRLISDKNTHGDTANIRISNLKSFLHGEADANAGAGQPLADLFLETTVLFADISGFTAWSSVREPTQVFSLLETVFSQFDQIAKARRVFKVETVGDCYVAATGIPEPKKDHATIMVRFAHDILKRMDVLVKGLEITHGPDTADLSLRIGMHSGPVTAGVLRGERARFQLFGDTMNTASRIENTGEIGRIHVSRETAECVRRCGKGYWLVKREEKVYAKGKGDMQTYWIARSLSRPKNGSVTGSCSSDIEDAHDSFDNAEGLSLLGIQQRVESSGLDEKQLRLVDWNVVMLTQILQQVVAHRQAVGPQAPAISRKKADEGSQIQPAIFIPLDEVCEIVHLPEFNQKAAHGSASAKGAAPAIDQRVVDQLRSFVEAIAAMYQDNPFHNFEHASHVTMSVIKLLARIVAPSDLDFADKGNAAVPVSSGNSIASGKSSAISGNMSAKHVAASLHDHTYGITSDPLTQFACAFSAMIHDVDHSGVPNAQLIKEKTRVAAIYNNRSVAEQNSLVLAWDLFTSDQYTDFRNCLCGNEQDLQRFRQLVVNGVMATDIVDKDLKQLRNGRWDKAFSDNTFDESIKDATDRKATIVIEHLIQASDVAHTMQHWHVYRKWNERFFKECYAAYRSGRSETNPADGWYKGEMGFFDFYIIPLAKKLKECGVFGKSSDEYLNYAIANREEWERRGEELVATMTDAMDQSIRSNEA